MISTRSNESLGGRNVCDDRWLAAVFSQYSHTNRDSYQPSLLRRQCYCSTVIKYTTVLLTGPTDHRPNTLLVITLHYCLSRPSSAENKDPVSGRGRQHTLTSGRLLLASEEKKLGGHTGTASHSKHAEDYCIAVNRKVVGCGQERGGPDSIEQYTNHIAQTWTQYSASGINKKPRR